MDIECHPDDVIDKTGSTFRIAGPSAENRLTSAHASKVCGHVVFEIRSRTDRHARRNISQRNWGVGEVRSDWSRDAAGTAQHDAANSSFVSLIAAAAAASAKLLLLLWRADLITRRRASERASDRHCAVARPTRHGESCADTSSRRPTPARRGEADGERAVERRSRAVAPGRRRRRCRCDVVALITAV